MDAHYHRPSGIDGPAAPVLSLRHGQDVVAVGDAPGAGAGLDASSQPAVRLGGEIDEIESAHRALQADVQLADPPFRERVDADARELAALVKRRQVLLVAGQAVEGLGHNDLEQATAYAVEKGLASALSSAS